MTEHEMVGWHHQLGGHEFEQALGVGDGQGSLACYSLWGCKELDLAEPLNPLKKRKKKKKQAGNRNLNHMALFRDRIKLKCHH